MGGKNTAVLNTNILSCLLAYGSTLVDTNVLLILYVYRCSVQGLLKAVLLCLRYVNAVAFGAWFSAFVVCAEEKQVVQKQKNRGWLCSSEAIWR